MIGRRPVVWLPTKHERQAFSIDVVPWSFLVKVSNMHIGAYITVINVNNLQKKPWELQGRMNHP